MLILLFCHVNLMNTIDVICCNCIRKSAGLAKLYFASSLRPQLLNACTYITRSERGASMLDYYVALQTIRLKQRSQMHLTCTIIYGFIKWLFLEAYLQSMPRHYT